MRKMPCLFIREFHGRDFTITPVVTPEAQWVMDEASRVFIKRDGTACAVIGGALFKRYDAKKGKTPPTGAVPCTEAPDEVTGHWPHWVAVVADDPASKWHNEAWARVGSLADGTYELCGPPFSANPEGFEVSTFIKHDSEPTTIDDLSFEGLRAFLETFSHEGVVWHHPDGIRKVKLRRDDFGFAWPLVDIAPSSPEA